MLPVASVVTSQETETQEANQTSASAIQPKPPKTTVLVVDDEDFVRDLLKDILECEGCEVYVATDGTEALDMFAKTQVDCVFTDVGMPGMSGWELAQAIREKNQAIPIAVITGWGEAVGSNEQKAAGVDWVVAKPFTADRICELIKSVNEKRSEMLRLSTMRSAAA